MRRLLLHPQSGKCFSYVLLTASPASGQKKERQRFNFITPDKDSVKGILTTSAADGSAVRECGETPQSYPRQQGGVIMIYTDHIQEH
jgi:hypothetical protein